MLLKINKHARLNLCFPAALIGPSILSALPIVIEEGDQGTYFCTSPNHPDLNADLSWIPPIGAPTDEITSQGSILFISSVSRHHAGVFMCTVETPEGRRISVSAPLIVNCEYQKTESP